MSITTVPPPARAVQRSGAARVLCTCLRVHPPTSPGASPADPQGGHQLGQLTLECLDLALGMGGPFEGHCLGLARLGRRGFLTVGPFGRAGHLVGAPPLRLRQARPENLVLGQPCGGPSAARAGFPARLRGVAVRPSAARRSRRSRTVSVGMLSISLRHSAASSTGVIAVGTLITERPPHRSGRAQLRHPAPTLGV
jgi:hypothetical protein